jgi:4-diphosphocytidyl-2-C-methyl-D-erythritol kinase
VTGWRERAAPAKLNLALVVGSIRHDGKHEIVSVMQRITLADSVAVRRAATTSVTGFADDTLVEAALEAITDAAGGSPFFEARIDKRIPVAAGLGGGSSDAAAALLLANQLLDEPLPADALHRLGAALGADVPYFLTRGAQLATGDGTTLAPIELPLDYDVVLALPHGAAKESTRAVYAAFDALGGARCFDERRAALRAALARVEVGSDLAGLPPNDLASSRLVEELRDRGAFRADVTGAGPVVYGLFSSASDARRAAAALDDRADTWTARPC